MFPNLGPLKMWSLLYGVSILSFFPVSFMVCRYLGARRLLWFVLSLSYLIGMTSGAKALWDLQHDEFSLLALFRPDHYLAGGLWGGVLMYFALAVPLSLMIAEFKRTALDALALSLPVPLMFTKLGCLLNGCCHGVGSSMPWAVTFPAGASTAPPGVPVHPTQIYELAVIVGVLAVFRMLVHERWRGTLLPWLLIFYGLGRAATEIVRADLQERGYTIGPFSLSQVLCVAAALLSVFVLWLWRSKDVDAIPGGYR